MGVNRLEDGAAGDHEIGPPNPDAGVGRARVAYSPKKAESLEAIGRKFGLGSRDLARINRMKHTSVIEPGQTIIVYKVVDKNRSDRAAK